MLTHTLNDARILKAVPTDLISLITRSIVSIVANYNFTPKFEIGAKWQYLNGTSEVPISSVVLVQDPLTRGLNPLLADVDEAVTAELTPYHKLDLRVSYKFDFMGLTSRWVP